MFLAVFAAGAVATRVIDFGFWSLGNDQISLVLEGLFVSFVVVPLFLGMRLYEGGRFRAPNRIDGGNALVLFLVMPGFHSVLQPVLGGLERAGVVEASRALELLALAAMGGLLSLALVRVEETVARVRSGHDDEAGQASRRALVQGVMILALLLSFGAFARNTNQHLLAREAAEGAALSGSITRLRALTELTGRRALMERDGDGLSQGFTVALSMARAQGSNASTLVDSYYRRNEKGFASYAKMPLRASFDRSWRRFLEAGHEFQRAGRDTRPALAQALVYAIDELSPQLDRMAVAIAAVEAERGLHRGSVLRDGVTATLGILIAASLLLPLFSVTRAQMDRVEKALARAKRLNSQLESYQRAIDEQAIFSVTNAMGKILQVNEQFVKSCSYSREEIIGQAHRILHSGVHAPEFYQAMWRTISRKGVWRGEICNRASDGRLFWVDSCITPLVGEDGRVERYVSIAYDITERKKNELRQDRKHRLEKAIGAMRSEMMVHGSIYGTLPETLEVLNTVVGAPSSLVVEIGRNKDGHAWGLMLGYAKREEISAQGEPGALPWLVNGSAVPDIILDTFRQNELFGGLNARQLGASAFFAVPLSAGLDPLGVLLIGADFPREAFEEEIAQVSVALSELLTARRESDRRRSNEEQQRRLAKRDPLTGLGNRRDLVEEFEARTDHPDSKFGLLLVDLDRFKPINDTFGHVVGDTVLRVVAERLQSAIRGDYAISRTGGDEFAILTEAHVALDEEGALELAHRIISELSEPIKCDGHVLSIGASIGVALYPRDGSTFQDVLHCADAAMHRAKVNRSEAQVFNASMDEGMRDRAELETDLRRALDDGSIVPYFQPFVDLNTGKVMGHEVLARWQHPVRGNISPVVFVKIAEESGLIDKLFWHILRTSCRKHLAAGVNTTLSINLSPAQIENPIFAKQLIEEIERLRFPPHLLEVEITETSTVGDLDRARPMLLLLKGCGIQIALDDFGIGYSSLALLRNMPISKLKIDRSFTADLETQETGRTTIINAILGIANAMFLKVTAEGIEYPEVADYLRQHGAHYGQGYLYGKPNADIIVQSLYEHPGPVAKRA